MLAATRIYILRNLAGRQMADCADPGGHRVCPYDLV